MTTAAAITAPSPITEAPATPARPGWWQHMFLLWGLRVTLARGALAQRWVAISSAGGAVAVLVTAGLAARATFALFATDAVHEDGRLALFLALLLSFLASTLWITWPIVTASVDDAAELSRFALFPVPPRRLFLASVLAGLVEPRTLPVWGALLGAWAGLASRGHGHVWIGLTSTLLLAAFSVVWGRVGLHLLLNLFRQRRSAETMGAGLILLLCCAAFVPPPNLEWLRELNAVSPTVDEAFLRGSIVTFSLLPPGGWAWAVVSDSAHRLRLAPGPLAYLAGATVAGYYAAFWLLLRFHRRAGRSLPQRLDERAGRSAFQQASIDRVLVEREWRDLLLNARARLTVALPFFLAIVMKLVGARALLAELIGPGGDAWLAGGVASYGALVLAAGFAQNSFGYDGAGAQLYLGAPVTIGRVLRAKNIVHGGVAFVLGLVLVAFYSAYIALPPAWVLLAVPCNVAYQAFLLLALGNVLSVLSPRKFHPSLKRRDRVSAFATVLGLAGAGLAVAPGAAVLRHLHGGPPGVAVAVLCVTLPLLAATIWRVSIPLAESLLATRRPALLRALARE